MAYNAQGLLIRRQSTTAGTTAHIESSMITLDTVAHKINCSDTSDFTTGVGGLLFSTGYRCYSNATKLNGSSWFTIADASATSMTIHEQFATSVSSGTTFQITGHKYDKIASIKSFNLNPASPSIIDVSGLDSTAKEFIVGLGDEGELTFDVHLNPAATALHIALKNDRANRTKRSFDIMFTDSTARTSSASTQAPTWCHFDAYVTNLQISGGVDDVVNASLTLKLTSAIHWVAKVTS